MIKNRYTSAITDKPWWLAGGIPAANCIAAYQPIGAAGYEESKVNLANPGAFNATNGAAYPTWDMRYGWVFIKDHNKWLDTGILPLGNMSAFIAFTSCDQASVAFGSYSGNDTTRFTLYPRLSGDNCVFEHAGATTFSKTDGYTEGVMGISGQQGYYNGSPVGGIIPGSWSGVATSTIGIAKQNGWNAYGSITVEAFVIYNVNITADQVAALTAAMNAL